MAETLGRLLTGQGERSDYDAASQCSRCGYCEQACPTYVATGRESFSPRGRNQLVRMLLEGKLKDPASAQEALSTCLLCGACSTACYAHVPTAELVLEGRRMLRGAQPAPARLLSWLLLRRPRLLPHLLRAAHAAKRLGLDRLAVASGILRLLGLQGLATAAEHVEEAPLLFLSERLRRDPALRDASDARWLYFAACGPNYLYPRVGLATVRVLRAARGRGAFLDNPCCGLPFYNYGDLESARVLARRNIERLESRAPGPEGPELVADCSSCAAHLKAYPRLFLEEPGWRERAERFSARVRDIVELEDCAPGGKAAASSAVFTYHDSCRARHGQGLVEPPRAWMRRLAGPGCAELPASSECCGGAGAFAFANPELSDELLKRKVGHIASVQARVVVTSSTSCLLQLARGLKKYYPECRVMHLSEIASETLG